MAKKKLPLAERQEEMRRRWAPLYPQPGRPRKEITDADGFQGVGRGNSEDARLLRWLRYFPLLNPNADQPTRARFRCLLRQIIFRAAVVEGKTWALLYSLRYLPPPKEVEAEIQQMLREQETEK